MLFIPLVLGEGVMLVRAWLGLSWIPVLWNLILLPLLPSAGRTPRHYTLVDASPVLPDLTGRAKPLPVIIIQEDSWSMKADPPAQDSQHLDGHIH
uniref:Bm11767 n=1 Tax=Brugia malayi TaxID=6279 RepID=A0A1I9G9R6_BRUMA|nr:Bm11767 [Brugia malayi]